MKDYNQHEYDVCRDWMNNRRKEGRSWEWIRFEGDRKTRLSVLLEDNFNNRFTEEDWLAIAEKEQKDEESRIPINSSNTTLSDGQQLNNTFVPDGEKTAWQSYRRHLEGSGFSKDVLNEMEKKIHQILQHLDADNAGSEPVKGLVIGSVQSGKTANMAGLIAMAADWGWNFFIILSGTIENLRRQTQNRLERDLRSYSSNCSWTILEHLSVKGGRRLSSLNLKSDRDVKEDRYLSVVLKNGNRLQQLLGWLKGDLKNRANLKILVIDDEADQAGINTAPIDQKKVTPLSELIRHLVNGKDAKGRPVPTRFKAMNYVGYTATPYANILNEKPDPENLYPSRFITTLDPILEASNEYFGPQQIFGLRQECYTEVEDRRPLGIIRDVTDGDVKLIDALELGESDKIPKTLQDSILWFVCGVACMRYWGYKKPISMLIHTSQKTDDHNILAKAIRDWLSNVSSKLKKCRVLWEKETSLFPLAKFKKNFKDYGLLDKVRNYPSYDEIEEHIKCLLGSKVTNIPLNEDGDLTYRDGIHLCVDNCKNNGVYSDDEGEFKVRLAYPDPEMDPYPSPAPAFIVIGGATLSRGLTIEGLISTYFMRQSKQEDTLMQMGRWFGYRKGYELIPRVWLPKDVKRRFEIMSEVDYGLRDEIKRMAVLGRSPSAYGPKVRQSPKLNFLRITAKSRMQQAVVDLNYGDTYNQTYLFDNDSSILKGNIVAAKELLAELRKNIGEYEKGLAYAGKSKVWKNVDSCYIIRFLQKYSFQQNQSSFANKDNTIQWIKNNSEPRSGKETLQPWNVIFVSNDHPSNGVKALDWDFGGEEFYKVNRSRIKPDDEKSKVLNIGALRGPKDFIKDVDLNRVAESNLNIIQNLASSNLNKENVNEIRKLAGVDRSPLLLIYIIDRHSKPMVGKKNKSERYERVNLDAEKDVIGVGVRIPEIDGVHSFVRLPISSNDDNNVVMEP